MVTAVLTLTLLTVVASLASWLFGQWLAGRTRISGAALAVGGGGTLLLISAVALVMIGAATWSRVLIPVHDFSPLSAPAVAPASSSPAVIDPDWAATDCVFPTRSDEAARWLLDNECGWVVAVAFQSCEFGERGCSDDRTPAQAGRWRYEPDGILMTAANDRPVLLRVGGHGPLVAPIFTIRDVAGARRQIRYVACEVTAPRVLHLLRDPGTDELAQQRLADALGDDACYSQVLRWTRTGRSLDELLRNRNQVGKQQ